MKHLANYCHLLDAGHRERASEKKLVWERICLKLRLRLRNMCQFVISSSVCSVHTWRFSHMSSPDANSCWWTWRTSFLRLLTQQHHIRPQVWHVFSCGTGSKHQQICSFVSNQNIYLRNGIMSAPWLVGNECKDEAHESKGQKKRKNQPKVILEAFI